jgi:hypothetical protein
MIKTKSAKLRSAKPQKHNCTQTLLRNHEPIYKCLYWARQINPKLKIWIIGSGVLEPLLTGALCQLFMDVGLISNYEIFCLDKCYEVYKTLGGIKTKEPIDLPDERGAIHRVVKKDGSLNLSALAHIFIATTAKVNPWLTNEVALSATFQQWIDFGTAPYLDIWPDICHSKQKLNNYLVSGGLLPSEKILDRIMVLHGDIIDKNTFDIEPNWANVVISNFATQYPIWEGQGKKIVDNIANHLSSSVMMQISNAYEAQYLLLNLIVNHINRKLSFEMALREAYIAKYVNDSSDKSRLIPRVDTFFWNEPKPEGIILKKTIENVNNYTRHHGGQQVNFKNPEKLSYLMKEHEGLEGGEIVYYAIWDAKNRIGTAFLLERDKLLNMGRIPFRIGCPLHL